MPSKYDGKTLKQTEKTTLRIEKHVCEWIRIESKKTNRSMADIIREALDKYINNKPLH